MKYLFLLMLMIPSLVQANPHNISDELVVVFTIVMEARSEGLDGMKAVGQVIANRAKQRHLTPAEACLQPKQFSCWNQVMKQVHLYVLYKECETMGIWDDAVTIARQVMAHNKPICEKVEFATHYYNPSLCNPSWALLSTRTEQVGNHVFCKLN